MTPKDSVADNDEAGEQAPAATAPERVSSPAATGGGGTTFEQHVGAFWLAQLLVGAIPPVLINATVSEVMFQTKRLGWNTDDLLIVCNEGERKRKLAAQVKRTFTVSPSDPECEQTVGSFWKDFNGAHFSKENDRLALIVLRGTNTLLAQFAGLLDCARAARDGADFEQRLGTPGFVSGTAKGYCGEVQKIVGAIGQKPVTAADIWPFLRALHVLSLDLFTETRQAEAQIKSMLALAATEGDPVASAAASWNDLLREASTAMASGRSLRHQDLPAATTARHRAIATDDRRVLQALADHTAPVLRFIRSTLGRDFHLPRAGLVQQVLAAVRTSQVVIVTGPAGSGKSAVGKDVVSVLAQDHFRFAFRVEEFAQAHMDATLTAAQVPANWNRIRAILGAQERKLVLVESVERLLEKTTRDAFSDLMTLVADDPGLRIVLTCRDYSAEQVRASFLQPHGIEPIVIQVPPLDDAERAAAERAYSGLAIPLKSPALRDLLRNPFLLDKALGISWSDEKSLPQDEREFRALFWREIVRGGNRVAPAMGRPRQETLQSIAVQRARALSAHIPVTGLDPAAVESLRGDSLIVSPADNPLLVAPAHDVLEDWSILQWLEDQHLAQVPFKALSEAIGPHPAVRRSYRKWVAELVARDPAAADRLFEAAISEGEISPQFRDDTLISLLKAPSAPEFFVRHEAQLVADRALLRRVIHLLRVACVKTEDVFAALGAQGSISNVPDGPAWPAVLGLVHRNLAACTNSDRALLLRLVDDAVRGVTWWAPRPEGAEDVAAIAHWLLDGQLGYRDGDARKRILKVVAKIPMADAARFAAVLRGQGEEDEDRDVVAEDFQQLVFAGVDGGCAARDLPDLIISVGREYLLASEDDLDDEHRYQRPMDVDLYFGIKEGLGRDSFPPSARRGPWLTLLRVHPIKALAFYTEVFDHSADWYAHPRLPEPLEKAWEVELTFADGSTHKQWMNGRLWGLYRGITVGPHPVLSMLMALETWLLEVGSQEPQTLDRILMHILRRSRNAALAAVVASAAIATPLAASEALLVLLSVRDYVLADRVRMATEHAAAIMAGISGHAEDRIYEQERHQANALPHRRFDLEAAIATLQMAPLADRVQALLDHHRLALPPKDEQNEEDKLWRLALHRMDLRQVTISEVPGTERPEKKADDETEPPVRIIRLDPKPPEADLQLLVDENAARQSAMNSRMGLLMWGVHAFERATGKYDPEQWLARLAEAQAMPPGIDDGIGTVNAPGVVAAVCVRHHWDEMAPAQREWCVDTICVEVLRHAEDNDRMNRVQRNPMAADRACASVLAALLRKPMDATPTERLKAAFAVALTHPVDEVKSYATSGIDENLWAADRALALRCLNAIAAEAAALDEVVKAERARPYEERGNASDVMAAATADIRARFWDEEPFPDDAHGTVDISTPFGRGALKRILAILLRVPLDPLAIAAFLRASHMLAGCWTSDDNGERRRNRDFHSESDVSQCIQEFLMRTSQKAAQEVLAPLLATIDDHSRELYSVMQGLTGIQDRNPNLAQYWFLWDLIAAAVKNAKWVSRLDADRHWTGNEFLSAVFLTLYWKDGVRHWHSLEGYADRVHALFEALPATSTVLGYYTRFLYEIGERSLPDAFRRVASALRRGDAQKMVADSNTVFMLEVLVQRFVYGRPLELKRDSAARDALLFILDALVEAGSSAAFRMRDDFVTPAV